MKILAIKHLNVKQKDGQVKPSILVTTAKADIWVTPGQWKSAGAGASLDSYNGGNIEAVYFTKGEVLFDGKTECTEEGKILKSVFVSANPTVLGIATAIADKASMEEANDLAFLYARQRADKRAKDEAKAIADAEALAQLQAQQQGAEAGKVIA